MTLIPVPAWPSSPSMCMAIFQCGHVQIMAENRLAGKRTPFFGTCYYCPGWRQVAQFIWLPPRDAQGRLYD